MCSNGVGGALSTWRGRVGGAARSGTCGVCGDGMVCVGGEKEEVRRSGGGMG